MQSGTTPGADATRLANGNLTYEGAQAQLTARGVTWQRLETWGDQGDWKFTCSIPNKQNPYISRTYEAEAHDPLLRPSAASSTSSITISGNQALATDEHGFHG